MRLQNLLCDQNTSISQTMRVERLVPSDPKASGALSYTLLSAKPRLQNQTVDLELESTRAVLVLMLSLVISVRSSASLDIAWYQEYWL